MPARSRKKRGAQHQRAHSSEPAEVESEATEVAIPRSFTSDSREQSELEVTPSKTGIHSLSFEILDSVFGYFSAQRWSTTSSLSTPWKRTAENDAIGSYYQAQQDLLNFCTVSKQFCRVAQCVFSSCLCTLRTD